MRAGIGQFFSLLTVLVLLSACGQKGPLYLPGESPEQRPAPPPGVASQTTPGPAQ